MTPPFHDSRGSHFSLGRNNSPGVKLRGIHFGLTYWPFVARRAWPTAACSAFRPSYLAYKLLYARYPIVARALRRVRARAKVSCIQIKLLQYEKFGNLLSVEI